MNKDIPKEQAPETPAKLKHIDVRFTDDEYNLVVGKAAKCGKPKSIYIHDLAIGHQPCQLMTDAQEAALMSLGDARSELVSVRNALHGQSQEMRKRLFKNEQFMQMWISSLEALIRQFTQIQHHFKNCL